MKKYRKAIQAAEGQENDKLQMAMDGLKDDFDFFLSGLEKLERTGAEESNQALILSERLSDALQNVIAELSAQIGG